MKSELAKVAVISAVSLTALGLTSQMAMADGLKPYVSVFGGAAFLNDIKGRTFFRSSSFSTSSPGTFKNKTGYILGAAIGQRWNDKIRTEIEISHSSNAASSFLFQDGHNRTFIGGSVEQTFLMGNVWFNLPTHSAFSPYAGGGVGVGWANATFERSPSNTSINSPSSGIAWQLGAGINYSLSEHFVLDVGYRYKSITGLNFLAASNSSTLYKITDSSTSEHVVQVGLTYNF